MKVEEAPVDQIVREGESAHFRCLVLPPPAHAEWLFRDDVIDSRGCDVTAADSGLKSSCL